LWSFEAMGTVREKTRPAEPPQMYTARARARARAIDRSWFLALHSSAAATKVVAEVVVVTFAQ
jgi:hypothetical protein